jgi:hypothetical protein
MAFSNKYFSMFIKLNHMARVKNEDDKEVEGKSFLLIRSMDGKNKSK